MLESLTGFVVVGVAILVGWILGRVDLLGEHGRPVLARLTFFVLSPFLLFVVLAQADTGVRSDVTPRMAPTRRREQLRMIEDQLLAESTLADLKRAAAVEAAGGKSGR